MLYKLRHRAQGEQGFTLIELLVVILIIGILGAIAIPAFLSQREKGQDAAAKVGATTARTAIETLATDNSGRYTSATVANLRTIEPVLNNVVFVLNPAPTANTYSIVVTSTSGNTFTLARTGGGVINRTCSGGGGCNGGSW